MRLYKSKAAAVLSTALLVAAGDIRIAVANPLHDQEVTANGCEGGFYHDYRSNPTFGSAETETTGHTATCDPGVGAGVTLSGGIFSYKWSSSRFVIKAHQGTNEFWIESTHDWTDNTGHIWSYSYK